MRGNNAPASRAVHPRRVSVGCVNPLHVPPPKLCQSRYCSRFFWHIPARTTRNRGRSVAAGAVPMFVSAKFGRAICRDLAAGLGKLLYLGENTQNFIGAARRAGPILRFGGTGPENRDLRVGEKLIGPRKKSVKVGLPATRLSH